MTDQPETTGPSEPERAAAEAQSAEATSAESATPPEIESLAAPDAAGEANLVDKERIDSLLDEAQAALSALNEPTPLPPGVTPFEFQNLSGVTPANETASLDLLRDVQLDLKIELGRTHMHLEDVLRLKHGAVVTLDKLAGDPVDIYANGRLIARGEVLVLNDNFCVRVAELITDDAVRV